MKVIEPGHSYSLDNTDGGSQLLMFVEKVLEQDQSTITHDTREPERRDRPDAARSRTLMTVTPGTTNEEVLRMMIDRYRWLQARNPCRENTIILTKLAECLMWQNYRQADRAARGVLGTDQK